MDDNYRRSDMPLAYENNRIAFFKFAGFKYPEDYLMRNSLVTDCYFTSELERLTAIKVYKSHNKSVVDKKAEKEAKKE